MRKIYILITLLFVFFVAIVVGLISFKQENKKNYSFLGMFPFELKSEKNALLNLIDRIIMALDISIMSGFSLYLLIYNIESTILTKGLGILLIVTSILLISLFIINFRSFSTHILASSIFSALVFLSYVLFGYIALININECFYLYQAVISFILALILLIIMFLPSLSSWYKLKKNKDETIERGKYNLLACLEWLSIILFVFEFVLISFSKLY